MFNRLKSCRPAMYAGCFLMTVFLAVALLILGACLPQGRIVTNIKESAPMISEEGPYPFVADKTQASMMENHTDTLILMYSCEMNSSDFLSVLTNPSISFDGEVADSLYEYVENDAPERGGNYVRYWMGFRLPVRILLSLFNFLQIRRYLIFSMYVLLAMVICSAAKWTGEKPAFLFALSIIMVRFHIVAQSMQYSCCFIIAFCAMLLVPWIYKHDKYETLFFMELGMITMYFDFYTTPILTFGLPAIYLYAVRTVHEQPVRKKQICADALAWGLGYVLMWIAKLVLTTLFTDINAIRDGFVSFAGRIGITKEDWLAEQYDSVKALRSVWNMLTSYPEESGKKVVAVALVVVLLWVLVRFIRNRQPLSSLRLNDAFLLIAVFPLIWFMVASQPTNIHAWFQYRGVAVTIWALMMYVYFTLERSSAEK